MTGLLFADTNLLIYNLDPADPAKQSLAFRILERGIASGRVVTSPQSLNECYRVLTTRRNLRSPSAAHAYVLSLFPTCRARLGLEILPLAWSVEADTGYAWWDCLLLASAIDHGCDYFLTEDLSDQQIIRGMTLLNPFTNDVTPLLS